MRLAGLLPIAGCVAVLAGCGSPAPNPTPTAGPVAKVGSTTITRAVFEARLQSTITAIQQAGGPAQSNAAMQAQVRASVLRSLILDAVIAQEAAVHGLAATDAEIAAQVSAAQQQAGSQASFQAELSQVGGSLAQFQDEIRAHLNEQRLEDFFAQQRAGQVEQQLASGATVAGLAATMSDDTGTNAKNGDLGALDAATLAADDASFSAAVRSLRVGAYTRTPVHDSGGYDIIQLYARTATTWSVRHILVAAPTPYTVRDRPQWFTAALFAAVAQDCSAGRIQVFITDAGANPCSGAPSLPASPAPG